MRSWTFLLVLPFFLHTLGTGTASGQTEVRFLDPDDKTGTSRAVVVGDVPLVHTGQILPQHASGKIVNKDQPAQQTGQVLDNLALALQAAQARLERVVKINVYAIDTQVVDAVKKVFAERFPGEVKPVVTFVVGRLPHPDALVAMDAVAVADLQGGGDVALVRSKALAGLVGASHAAVLPAGPKVYVAGQAEKGDLPQATRRTLESLRATLKHLGLNESHVVQLKAFLHPVGSVAVVEKELARFFGNRQVPPVVLVEWKSSLPIEIELIAAAPRGAGKSEEPLEFLTPPGMKASPIYSRVARVNQGKMIYIGGLYGPRGKDAAGEIEEIFTALGDILKKAGSDLRHLVKATYYVASDEASRKLNELRPRYYDPKRPPAASKALVSGVGVAGRSITLDMIAVAKP